MNMQQFRSGDSIGLSFNMFCFLKMQFLCWKVQRMGRYADAIQHPLHMTRGGGRPPRGSNLFWYDRPAGPTGRADWPGREVVLNIMKVWTRGRPSTLWKGLSMYR